MNQPHRDIQRRQTAPAASRAALSSSFDASAEADEDAALDHREWLLDDSLMQTFPASDAISPGFMT
jgi:hypothetical protein